MTAKEQRLEIAKTIQKQIKAIDFWALGAWGANTYVALSENSEKGVLGGLQFKCSGSKVRKGGLVTIELNGKDLYDITLYRVRGINVTVLAESKDVFCDMLVNVLDEMIG